MNKLVEGKLGHGSTFQSLDQQLSCHGLETDETFRLRNEIKKFFETNNFLIEQELRTENFSVMVGGSLQAGTTDRHSDIDLTIILDKGNADQIWLKGGVGKTDEGIRGILLFRQDALKKQLQRNVDINLITLESILMELNNLKSSCPEEDFVLIDNVVRIFSPQIYGVNKIENFRRLIVRKLASMPEGEIFWDKYIVPKFKDTLIDHTGAEKGNGWPETDGRSLAESQKRNELTKTISERLRTLEVPSFHALKMLY